jgi:hypothetical protein
MTEQAYKNGYEKGKEEVLRNFKKGKLVYLPVTVGDEVYVVKKIIKKHRICRFLVVGISKDSQSDWCSRLRKPVGNEFLHIPLKEEGKKFFLTKEGAERWIEDEC